jgi:hypothetical protein
MLRTFAIAVRAGQTALLLSGLACERPRVAVAREDTAPADTVVRRVIRVHRQASALQRVTGKTTALLALQPLDSVLAVRVMDQRGVEMADVPVSWSLASAGDGAELKILNGRTDSLGISRARFTPGSSAEEQAVHADVAQVGRISFAVAVAPRSIRVADQTVWSGDSVVVVAELRDMAGTVLAGGAVVWATTDSLVARADSRRDHAVVRGRLAGVASLVGWIEPGTVRTSARVRVKPVLNGRFITLDGSDPPTMRAELRVGARREALSVRDGRFSARIEISPGDEATLLAAQDSGAAVHSLRLTVTDHRALQNLAIVLVPARWRISGGSYDGQDVSIDAARALQRVEGTSAFWRLVPLSGQGPKRLLSWPKANLPLRLAFNRKRSVERVAADDSVHFWRIAAQVERDLGGQFFTPSDMHGDSSTAGVIPVEIGSNLGAGHTFVSWNSAGDAFDAVLTFRTAATLRDAHVVTHELLHLLGFGHTLGWPSVLRPSRGTEPRVTATDVAYVQLALKLRQLQLESGARPGLPPP